MEKTAVIKANAKINLTLDCFGRRGDGYHELEMLMCEIPLFDTVTVKKSEKIKIDTTLPFLPSDRSNTAYKAAEEFFAYTGITGGAEIFIEKVIPVAAGLAGGSTDAAAVLKGLNEIYDTKLTENELIKIGDKVGKDIPFCIKGGVCLARGAGEVLIPVGKLPHSYITLVKPDNINVSTAEVFTQFDSVKNELHPHTSGVIKCISDGDIKGIAQRMYNVLENVTAIIHPVINDIKAELIENGALGAVMSGSGSSVFGIFDELSYAQKAYDKFKKTYNQVFLLEM